MPSKGVLRPGHVQLRVRELSAAVQYYTQVVGLWETARDAQGRVYLKAWDEHDHHSLVLREAPTPGMDFMGFRVDSEKTLDTLAEDVRSSGLATDLKWVPPGEHVQTGRRFRFTVATGHAIELFAQKSQVGNMLPTTNPDPWPDGLRGMSPSRMDHCLLYGDDIDGAARLFMDVLGFGMSERVVGPQDFLLGAFLACSNKPHDIAFIRHAEKNKLHHVSFYLDNWGEVLRAADLISKHRVTHDIGPTRHGITRGETIYFFDPSGNRNEVFSGGYIYYPDRPTLTWTEGELGTGIFYHERRLNERFLAAVT